MDQLDGLVLTCGEKRCLPPRLPFLILDNSMHFNIFHKTSVPFLKIIRERIHI